MIQSFEALGRARQRGYMPSVSLIRRDGARFKADVTASLSLPFLFHFFIQIKEKLQLRASAFPLLYYAHTKND